MVSCWSSERSVLAPLQVTWLCGLCRHMWWCSSYFLLKPSKLRLQPGVEVWTSSLDRSDTRSRPQIWVDKPIETVQPLVILPSPHHSYRCSRPSDFFPVSEWRRQVTKVCFCLRVRPFSCLQLKPSCGSVTCTQLKLISSATHEDTPSYRAAANSKPRSSREGPDYIKTTIDLFK